MTGSSATRPGPAPVPAPVPGDVLLVTPRGEPHGGAAEQLRHDTAHRTASSPAPAGGAAIDISGVETVGSFPGRVLAGTAAHARLPATRTVLAGTRPAAAVTLVGLDTVLDVGRALLPLGHGPPATPSDHPEEGA
ncbi:anti-anti-sigma factor [Streptomyces cinerochromogenes]|uniref:anti-anti-sigma factor n=1 Tax=Streptomyces cinerochromogenes TaxID=66422 RepID=UPI0033B5E251